MSKSTRMESLQGNKDSTPAHSDADSAQRRVGDEILLLDDDPASLRMVQSVLRAAGYVCFSTHDPEEAIAVVARDRGIRLVVSDICMPDVDGLMFLDRLNVLRARRMLPHVLFLTGHPSLEHAVAALRLGAVDFLTKPVKPRELLYAVDRACQRARAPVTTGEQETEVRSLVQQAEVLVTRLRVLAEQAKSPALLQIHVPAASSAAAEEHCGTGTTVLDTIEQLRRLRDSYDAVLGDLDDVAWDLLLEVLRCERAGRRISVSGLCISGNDVSSTTALRRINDLVAQQHLLRIPDPTDARRDFVTIRDETRHALEDYLAKAGEYLVRAARAS